MSRHVLDFSFDELKSYLLERGQKAFGAKQIFDWVYRQLELDPQQWTNVSKALRAELCDSLDFSLPKIVWQGVSSDGTVKFLLRMGDGQTIESVAIPSGQRVTLCVSSQVGCAMGCTFCHTATQGLTRNLTAAEILGQFMVVSQWAKEHGIRDYSQKDPGPWHHKLHNVVFMGQGEPLHNPVQVKKAIINLMDDNAFGLGQRRITLSTSGLVPQIEKLSDFPSVNIALSLHAAHNDLRTELMPINKRWDLERLFQAIRSIPLKAHRYITYEYLLIEGVNDTAKDVDALCDLIPVEESKINLIPYNDYPGGPWKRPSKTRTIWFRDQLLKRGHICTIRATRGTDILAACGQLKSEYDKGTV